MIFGFLYFSFAIKFLLTLILMVRNSNIAAKKITDTEKKIRVNNMRIIKKVKKTLPVTAPSLPSSLGSTLYCWVFVFHKLNSTGLSLIFGPMCTGSWELQICSIYKYVQIYASIHEEKEYREVSSGKPPVFFTAVSPAGWACFLGSVKFKLDKSYIKNTKGE